MTTDTIGSVSGEVRSAETVHTGIRTWLASGALSSDAGAICAWREAGDGALAFEYPEISGYALTRFAGRVDPSPAERRTAHAAGRWLTERIAAGDRSARAGWDGGAIYTFDLGMIAAGLISWGEASGEGRFAGAGRGVAARLAELVASPEGLWSVDPAGPPTARESQWSTTGRPHLVKCVQALLLAGEDEAADELAASAERWASSEGFFETQPESGFTMLHPHLYTVEGLWIWASAREDSGAMDLARRATEWAWRHQLPGGGLPRFAPTGADSHPGDAPEQLDVTGQAVRAALLTGADVDGLERAVARLRSVAVETPDGHALPYQPQAEPHLNAWVSMFGGQALEIADGARIGWEELI